MPNPKASPSSDGISLDDALGQVAGGAKTLSLDEALSRVTSQPATPAPPAMSAEPTFAQRAGAAVGPAIRGVGDVTGVNKLLEYTGAVEPGRLTGDEATARDAATRSTTHVASLAYGGMAALDSVTRAAVANGLTMAERAVAVAKAAGSEIAPIVKYEMGKTVLTKLGVPEPIAAGISGIWAGTIRSSAAKAPSSETVAPLPAGADLGVNRLKVEQLVGQGMSRGEATRTVINSMIQGAR